MSSVSYSDLCEPQFDLTRVYKSVPIHRNSCDIPTEHNDDRPKWSLSFSFVSVGVSIRFNVTT